jgi:BirA family biotin operon repressor/biotin-[acetyl-CoA-carboxylase] ligase
MEKFIHVDRCNSTQDLLKEQLTHFGHADLTVSCEHQTKGRGRGENLWEDSPGTLCFSMTIAPHEIASFSALELSVLICQFFHKKKRFLKLKWPNDLLDSNGKKCGGILIQNHQGHFLAGIGINLFFEKESFGGVYQAPFHLDKKSWVQEIGHFIRHYRYQETERLKQDWMSLCAHMNVEVTISEGEKIVRGVFLGLGLHGEAIVQNAHAEESVFNGTLRY